MTNMSSTSNITRITTKQHHTHRKRINAAVSGQDTDFRDVSEPDLVVAIWYRSNWARSRNDRTKHEPKDKDKGEFIRGLSWY